MTTPRDIIDAAARDAGIIGVGQSLLSEDSNAAFTRLNRMLSEWQRDRYLVYQLVDLSLTSTGAASYTVGPGGAFNTGTNARPEKLQAAFIRQLTQAVPNQVDYPLTIINSYEDYSRIRLKRLTTVPQYVFLDTGFPLATLYPYPVIEANNWALHLIIKQALGQFTGLSQTIVLPEEYMSAMEYNLALRLGAAYRTPVSQDLKDLAKNSLMVLRQANTQVPTMRLPSVLLRPGLYDMYSDENY